MQDESEYWETVKSRLFKSRTIDPQTDCWLWGGCKANNYGSIMLAKPRVRRERVHRVSAKIYLGFNLNDSDIEACHKCDKPLCFNPEHLFIGTHQENMADAVSKGRIVFKGGGAPKLNADSVRQIRELFDEGYSKKRLSRRFNVDPRSIGRVVDRINWSWV
jgi:hypothetical protein